MVVSTYPFPSQENRRIFVGTEKLAMISSSVFPAFFIRRYRSLQRRAWFISRAMVSSSTSLENGLFFFHLISRQKAGWRSFPRCSDIASSAYCCIRALMVV